MGLLLRALTFPVSAPVGGGLWLARQISEHVDAERNSPAALRAALAEAERRLLSGEMDEETYDRIEDDILARLASTGGSR